MLHAAYNARQTADFEPHRVPRCEQLTESGAISEFYDDLDQISGLGG